MSFSPGRVALVLEESATTSSLGFSRPGKQAGRSKTLSPVLRETPVRLRAPPGGERGGRGLLKQSLGRRECARRMGSLLLSETQKRVTQTARIGCGLFDLPPGVSAGGR